MKYAAALLLSLLPLLAQALESGDTLAPWTLLDQYDQPYSLDTDTRILLVARDMDGAKLVKAALAEQPKGYLQARHAVFLADIQRMPAIIGKLFAIPAMRDYNYRVVLDREGRVASRYGVGEGRCCGCNWITGCSPGSGCTPMPRRSRPPWSVPRPEPA